MKPAARGLFLARSPVFSTFETPSWARGTRARGPTQKSVTASLQPCRQTYNMAASTGWS